MQNTTKTLDLELYVQNGNINETNKGVNMKTNEVKKTPIEVVDRSTILGGSDANRIMRGDWHTLWLEKTKRQEPEDLSWNLPVQIGYIPKQLIDYSLKKKQEYLL